MHEWEIEARLAELQDIAALDRLAADGQPASVLNRWAARGTGGTRRSLWQLLHRGR